MELQSARQIIDSLAQGIHPVTGQVMPEDSPYNAPPVIRALFTVSRALEGQRRGGPANARKPWTPEDDEKLASAFEAGSGVSQLMKDFGRTRNAVEARLVKLGKLPPGRGDVPFGSPRAH